MIRQVHFYIITSILKIISHILQILLLLLPFVACKSRREIVTSLTNYKSMLFFERKSADLDGEVGGYVGNLEK